MCLAREIHTIEGKKRIEHRTRFHTTQMHGRRLTWATTPPPPPAFRRRRRGAVSGFHALLRACRLALPTISVPFSPPHLLGCVPVLPQLPRLPSCFQPGLQKVGGEHGEPGETLHNKLPSFRKAIDDDPKNIGVELTGRMVPKCYQIRP